MVDLSWQELDKTLSSILTSQLLPDSQRTMDWVRFAEMVGGRWYVWLVCHLKKGDYYTCKHINKTSATYSERVNVVHPSVRRGILSIFFYQSSRLSPTSLIVGL